MSGHDERDILRGLFVGADGETPVAAKLELDLGDGRVAWTVDGLAGERPDQVASDDVATHDHLVEVKQTIVRSSRRRRAARAWPKPKHRRRSPHQDEGVLCPDCLGDEARMPHCDTCQGFGRIPSSTP